MKKKYNLESLTYPKIENLDCLILAIDYTTNKTSFISPLFDYINLDLIDKKLKLIIDMSSPSITEEFLKIQKNIEIINIQDLSDIAKKNLLQRTGERKKVQNIIKNFLTTAYK